MLTHKDIIRAWKDPVFRLSLTDAQRAQLPGNPAGPIKLTDADLAAALGGKDNYQATMDCLSIVVMCPAWWTK